jgi:HAD superfamily hydrolase (TIGR01509 family)
MAIKAVLFDIDGTLVDSNDLHVLAWRHAFRRIGVAFSPEVIHAQIGKGGDMLIPALLPGVDEKTQEDLDDAHGEIFKQHFISQVRPFPGARDLLARVRDAGRQVVLASSSSRSDVDFYLDLLDARDLVTATTSADDVEKSKPAPDIFASALNKVALLGPAEAMVVGDTPYDVEAARKCGIATIAVRSGKFPDESLSNAGAVAIYDDVEALLRDYSRSPLAN